MLYSYTTPWLNDSCLVVCDRFHYKSHTCDCVCDPDSYLSCSNHHTSGAEPVNHLWESSKSRAQYLSGENIMPFLSARSVFINLRTISRKKKNKSDT